MKNTDQLVHEMMGLCWHEWRMKERRNESFFNCSKCREPSDVVGMYGPDNPAYSTDISAAFRVLAHFRKNGWYVQVQGGSNDWGCLLEKDGKSFAADAETGTLAICNAALEAHEWERNVVK